MPQAPEPHPFRGWGLQTLLSLQPQHSCHIVHSHKRRVDDARKIQLNRFKGMKIYCNAQMTNRHIKKFCEIDETSQKLLEMAIDYLDWAPGLIHEYWRSPEPLPISKRRWISNPPTSPKPSSTAPWIGIWLDREGRAMTDEGLIKN